jgi:predicted nucleic acid-binding protein
VLVVDASVWVSSLIPQDSYHQASRGWLDRYLDRGGIVYEPVLLLSEVAGAVARLKADSQLGQQALQDLLEVPTLRLVPHDFDFGRVAAQMAADLRLRGADVVYVTAAYLLQMPLVTWDREQQQRAGSVIAVQTP